MLSRKGVQLSHHRSLRPYRRYLMPAATHEKERATRLAELLACEEELAGLMEAARAEGRRRVEAARQEAERAESELGQRLEEEADRARQQIEEAARAGVQALVDGARERVVRFDAVSDAEVTRLAVSALRRLLGPAED